MSGMQWHSTSVDLEAVTTALLGQLFRAARVSLARGWPATQKAWVARVSVSAPDAPQTVIVKWFAEGRRDAYMHEKAILVRLESFAISPHILGSSDEDMLLAMDDLGDAVDVDALAEALARLHEMTREHRWPVSRRPSVEQMAERIAANMARLGLTLRPDSELLAAARVLANSLRSLVHDDVLPGNCRRTPHSARVLDLEDAAEGAAMIDAAAPVVGFPTAPEDVGWTAGDRTRFEQVYRRRACTWYPRWADAHEYERDRAAAVAYWIGRALSANVIDHLSRPGSGRAIATRLRALGAVDQLAGNYPVLAEAARQFSTRLANADS
ncbi:MAG TPA: hypothetical protein VFC31_00390 [Candidatus Limnocylindria bacterium]|nr:hypothetical protein [Candidatus Limnocylindria bacterium]